MKAELLIRCKEELEDEVEEVPHYLNNQRDRCLRTLLLHHQFLIRMKWWLTKSLVLNLDWLEVKQLLLENDQVIRTLQEEVLLKWINHSLRKRKKNSLCDYLNRLQENQSNFKLLLQLETHLLHELLHQCNKLLKFQNKSFKPFSNSLNNQLLRKEHLDLINQSLKNPQKSETNQFLKR